MQDKCLFHAFCCIFSGKNCIFLTICPMRRNVVSNSNNCVTFYMKYRPTLQVTIIQIIIKTSNIMNTGKVLLGFLAGIATGAILGVLFAPAKGSSTRKKIVHRSDEYLTEMGEKFDEFIDGITKKFDSAKEEAARLADNGKTKVEAAENKFIATVK